VRLLEKENDQFKRDCDNKMNFQRKQERHLREENERLRMKVNDLGRPKVAVLAALEEKQAQLVQQVEAYSAKNDLETRNLEEIETQLEITSASIMKCQERIRSKIKQTELSRDELEKLGYRNLAECPNRCLPAHEDGAPVASKAPAKPGQPPEDGKKCTVCKLTLRSFWVDKKGDRYKSKGDIERARSYVPDIKLKKKLAMLEGRVEQTLIKFNESLVVNKELRAEIEHLRKERMQFDSIQAKLENELNQKKADIALAIEATNVALETRDEANKKIAHHRAEIQNNQLDFDTKWRELDNMMDSEEKRRRQVRAKIEQEEQRKKSKVDDDAEQKKHLEELTAKYEESKADVQRFEEAFENLKEATGLKNIDELVQTFLEAEEQNFKLFNFLNELNQEEEKLVEEVNKISAEAVEVACAGDQPEKQELRRKHEDQLAQLQARTDELSEMEEEESTKVREILKIIKRVHDELGCSKLINTEDSFQCDQSGNPIITDSNMMYFLGIIEQRARDLMLRLIKDQSEAVDDGPGRRDLKLSCVCPLGNGPSVPIGGSKLEVTAPKIDASAPHSLSPCHQFSCNFNTYQPGDAHAQPRPVSFSIPEVYSDILHCGVFVLHQPPVMTRAAMKSRTMIKTMIHDQ